MVGRVALRFVLLLGLGSATAGLAGCATIRAPQVPSTTRTPTIVGQVRGWAVPNVSIELDTGAIVEVDSAAEGVAKPARLSDSDYEFSRGGVAGGLLLAGTDGDGRFYAATTSPEDGCFRLRGAGYIDPDRLHYSSGLVIPLASEVERDNQRSYYDASWLFDFDVVCLDATGSVTLITQLPLGA